MKRAAMLGFRVQQGRWGCGICLPQLCAALLLIAGFALSAQSARAQISASGPVVVELFTSQGCSSCPPADALMNELASRADVLPLGLHVDYWDYIGWPDTFAQPQFSRRQEAYVRAAGGRRVYTPHMVVAGADHLVGAQPMELADLIRAHAAKGYPVAVELSRSAQGYRVMAQTDQPAPMVVQVIRFIPRATVDITRGENAGRDAHYSNVVQDLEILGDWDGRSPFARDIASDPELAMAVVVQVRIGPGALGPVMGAAIAPR
ncbi:DUF1223 domain-containing protein [Rhodobacteraceae bacterium XHP0102]|nr:DUF1223 domain-containing protein [Rhodobacteraceae bacterium XHP0102]